MSEIKLNVRHNSDVISIPFTDVKNGLSAAIRHGGVNFFNTLVAPSAPNASKICLRHNNTAYALSLPQASESYVKPVVTFSSQIIDKEKTVTGPYPDVERVAWNWEYMGEGETNIYLPQFFQVGDTLQPFEIYGKNGDQLSLVYKDYYASAEMHALPGDNGDLPYAFCNPYIATGLSDDEFFDFLEKIGFVYTTSTHGYGSAQVTFKWKFYETTVNIAAMLLTQEGDYDYYHTLFAPNIYSPESYDEEGAAIMFLEVDTGYVIESISVVGQNGVALVQGTDFFLADYTHDSFWSADSSHVTFTQAALDKVQNKINLSYVFSEFID